MKKLITLLVTIVVTTSNFVGVAQAHNDTYYTDPYYNNAGYTNTQYYYPSQRVTPKKKVAKRTTTRQPQIIYIYQNVPNSGYAYTQYNPGYPGCGRADIIVGGQIWAACNVAGGSNGATGVSGWFFANDLRASFLSSNGQNTRLEWQGKVIPVANWGDGPCAAGYRLPTQSEWETALYYARQNSTSVTTLLNLPQNGGYRGYKDSNSDVRIESRTDTAASYWSSTVAYNGGYFPVIMRVGAVYQNYRLDGTYGTYSTSSYNWQYTDTGLQLIAGTSSDLANVRCIRK